MNPPFENKYGCIQIVKNVLDNVQRGTMCAFILPEKKLEKVSKTIVKRILQKHTLRKIVKLPDKTFSEGITTSVFIFESGIPQDNKEIFSCYIEEDGLITVKNQGRHDIKNKWQSYEDYWVDIVHKQSGDKTIQWIKPNECLSYQVPQKPFEIYESDFRKTAMDYILFENGIDNKEFEEKILKSTMYSSTISASDKKVNISISTNGDENE